MYNLLCNVPGQYEGVYIVPVPSLSVCGVRAMEEGAKYQATRVCLFGYAVWAYECPGTGTRQCLVSGQTVR